MLALSDAIASSAPSTPPSAVTPQIARIDQSESIDIHDPGLERDHLQFGANQSRVALRLNGRDRRVPLHLGGTRFLPKQLDVAPQQVKIARPLEARPDVARPGRIPVGPDRFPTPRSHPCR